MPPAPSGDAQPEKTKADPGNTTVADGRRDGGGQAAARRYMTLIGPMDVDGFSGLIRPALAGFANGRDDAPLGSFASAVTSAIESLRTHVGYRKIHDICQRYLVYLDEYSRASGLSPHSYDAISSAALLEYWRVQLMTMMVRDSGMIISLLAPGTSQGRLPPPICLPTGNLIAGASLLDAPGDGDGLSEFVRGRSFPYLGFDASSAFGTLETVPDGIITGLGLTGCFAVADPGRVASFHKKALECVGNLLLDDIVFTQHRKVYDEISTAFGRVVPEGFRSILNRRIGLDAPYGRMLENISSGRHHDVLPHRASRLELGPLNSAASLISALNASASLGLGAYVFHCVI